LEIADSDVPAEELDSSIRSRKFGHSLFQEHKATSNNERIVLRLSNNDTRFYEYLFDRQLRRVVADSHNSQLREEPCFSFPAIGLARYLRANPKRLARGYSKEGTDQRENSRFRPRPTFDRRS
jgi:hypothetical protein